MTKKQEGAEVGRPTVITPEVLNKLQQAFLRGYSNRAACIYADLVEGTYYKYCKENPEFIKKKEAWQENPVSLARDAVYNSLVEGDVQTAKWTLERKCKDEYSLRVENINQETTEIPLRDNERMKEIKKLVGKHENSEKSEPL